MVAPGYIAATASRNGCFRVDPGEAEKIGRQMHYGKGIDPTLAVYAAYAFNDVQLIDRIKQMSGYLSADVGTTFFDLELLGRDPRNLDRGRFQALREHQAEVAGEVGHRAHEAEEHRLLDGEELGPLRGTGGGAALAAGEECYLAEHLALAEVRDGMGLGPVGGLGQDLEHPLLDDE
jgi:hypothetical protein